MIKFNYEQLKELIIAKYGIKSFFTAPYDLNIIGYRSDNYVPDTFDDIIYIAYTNEAGFKKLFIAEATTDPSVYYLEHPANSKGTGILPAGRYPGLWRSGIHKGYPAFIQKNPCTIIRDVDRNKIAQFDINAPGVVKDTGMFGLDLHRYNKDIAVLNAHKGSMLCQVVCDPVDFNMMVNLRDKQIASIGVDSFSYVLLWENH